MSSTKASKLSKKTGSLSRLVHPLQRLTCATAHIVDIVVWSERGCCRVGGNCAIALAGVLEFRTELELREGSSRIDRHPAALTREQPFPCGRAALVIVHVLVLHLGDALEKHRIRRVDLVETPQQLERAIGLVLVPEIQVVQLKIDFSAEEHTSLSGLKHFAQSKSAIAPR